MDTGFQPPSHSTSPRLVQALLHGTVGSHASTRPPPVPVPRRAKGRPASTPSLSWMGRGGAVARHRAAAFGSGTRWASRRAHSPSTSDPAHFSHQTTDPRTAPRRVGLSPPPARPRRATGAAAGCARGTRSSPAAPPAWRSRAVDSDTRVTGRMGGGFGGAGSERGEAT